MTYETIDVTRAMPSGYWTTHQRLLKTAATTTIPETRRTNGMDDDELNLVVSPLRDLRSVVEHYLLTSGWHREARDEWTCRDLFCACVSLPFAVKRQLEHEDSIPFGEAS